MNKKSVQNVDKVLFREMVKKEVSNLIFARIVVTDGSKKVIIKRTFLRLITNGFLGEEH